MEEVFAVEAMRELMARGATRVRDRRVVLSGVGWKTYTRLLALRGDQALPRLSYLDGTLEIMTTSPAHERFKKVLGMLLEAYMLESGVDFDGVGNVTLRRKLKRSGLEPDECYVIGDENRDYPDLAIEVIWTHGGIEKLEIYRRLGVREVWFFCEGRLTVHALKRGGYRSGARSLLLPDLDLAELARFATLRGHSRSVAAYRKLLRSR